MNTFLKPLGTNRTFKTSQEYLLVPLLCHPLCPGMYLLQLENSVCPCVFCAQWLKVPFLVLSSSCLVLCPSKNFQTTKCGDSQLSTEISVAWQTNLFCWLTSTEGNIKRGTQKYGFLDRPAVQELTNSGQQNPVYYEGTWKECPLTCGFIVPSCSPQNHQTCRAHTNSGEGA